jgi:hypothetical protein
MKGKDAEKAIIRILSASFSASSASESPTDSDPIATRGDRDQVDELDSGRRATYRPRPMRPCGSYSTTSSPAAAKASSIC